MKGNLEWAWYSSYCDKQPLRRHVEPYTHLGGSEVWQHPVQRQTHSLPVCQVSRIKSGAASVYGVLLASIVSKMLRAARRLSRTAFLTVNLT